MRGVAGARLADLIVKARGVYTMHGSQTTFTARRAGWTVAASAEEAELDWLASGGTRVVDVRRLTLLPAPFETHEHLLESACDLAGVRLDGVRSLGQLVGPSAVALPASAGTRLTGESARRGTLQSRRRADGVGSATDPIGAAADDLPSLVPEFTLVGGRAHDPGDLFAADGAEGR